MTGFLQFAFLFVMVWWAWLNGSIYHDLHGNNDIRTRVFTFLQMIAVASMAVFAHDALGETSTGFALSYAAFLLILTILWWRSGVHDEAHRPLSRPYVAVFVFSFVLFILSIFLPSSLRVYLWGAGLLLSVLLPIYTGSLGRNSPELAAQQELAFTISPSAVERFGLFNIIVLGEIVVGVVQGLASHHHLTWLAGATGLGGMLVAIGMWWVYFDFVSHRQPLKHRFAGLGWVYLHLPLTISITAVGAAVLNMVEHSGEALPGEVRWLFSGAIMVAFITIALLIQIVQHGEAIQPIVRTGSVVILVSGVVIGLLGVSALETLPLLLCTIVLMMGSIFFGIWLWIKRVIGDAPVAESHN